MPKFLTLKHIRHIIFDLGGVLLNINYQLTEAAFIKLGVTDFKEQYTQLAQSDFFDAFETGKMSKDDFIVSLKAQAAPGCTDQQVIDAWNAMLLDLPLRRLQVLQQLQVHYDTFLLSNTNEIHEAACSKILKAQCGFTSLGVFFDRVYFSHRVGLRKPDKAIFELVLDQHHLNPAHTLYIDDSPQHIDPARELGIQTILMMPGMTMEDTIFKSKE